MYRAKDDTIHKEHSLPRPDLMRLAIFACALSAVFLPVLEVTIWSSRSQMTINGSLLALILVPLVAGLSLAAPWVKPIAKFQSVLGTTTGILAFLAVMALMYLLVAMAFFAILGSMASIPIMPLAVAVHDATTGETTDIRALYDEESHGAALGVGGWFMVAAFVLAIARPMFATYRPKS